MSILNFAANSYFDDDDFALSSVAKSRMKYESDGPDRYHMDVDMVETDTQFVVICDVPGIPKDRIHIQVKDDMICIDGKRKKKVISEHDKYLMTERRNGPFKRVIKMPNTCDTGRIAAKLEDGMLILTMPKVEDKQPATVIKIN